MAASAASITTFEEATSFVKGGAKPSKDVPNERKLRLYGLFKQATEGDNTAAKPGMLSTYEATYKWQAWEDNKGKSADDAKKAYVDELKAQIAEFY
ncbi:hypothetical protein FNF27_01663 [Cafeteria roenbergensis]|uniref:ACB domain-containing protein n=1 Tax=Cafeteria roenbergensis TaxID=33653 RepID=A0A5A8DRK9_CAFRO|nr:hypothetical protein FNF29_03931 [Cafeteria roenbergensis]KAA0167809.1 hypothetical protein FNF31_00744 [Cafeteria roenbergensis]KAA0171648.1 hypothetical protein FNF28_00581 [Cafeteria roenbergensis]KAA0176841.1 hypothetical protein FNF27_01663 [Cafeteria roenbergensis]|mmetsp:Transcript_20026/g.76774  ORF Transcript_20026/g.76774 Transcript_20026/m.76774 type:complete len:96 (+) Transcript_20026:40-327(+)|eukprot:KAA0152365.1 hypothetical protein FNF29_03931 [Cafeteria roenbergensis]